MRILILLLAFSAGAYLMLRVMTQMPAPAQSCLPDLICAVGESLTRSSEPARPGLQVVVYDPALEPLSPADETASLAALASHSAENGFVLGDLMNTDRTEATAPSGFQIVPLGEPGAHGFCAAFDGRRLHCVGLMSPPGE